jgi:hypothetical protein
MPILERKHDFGHPVEGDTAWSRPNEGTIDVGMSIWLPDGQIGFYRHVREQKSMIESDLVVGGVRYSMVEPMQTWRITMDAEASVLRRLDGEPATRAELPLAMDVTFDALAPAFGTDGQGRPGEGASATKGSPGWEYTRSVGYGISEYLHQMDGGARPVVPTD